MSLILTWGGGSNPPHSLPFDLLSLNYILLVGGVIIMRLLPVGPLLLVLGGAAVEAAAGVLPPRLLSLLGVSLLVLRSSALHVALHVGVRHQVDVSITVPLKTH